jgi:transcriptional regulator with XRE-family HTH domain
MINPARLQQAREVRGFTQTALAQQVGVHPSAIAQLETGRMQPSPEVLDAISRATEFPPAFFTRPSGPTFPLGSLRFRARAAMTARQRRQAWWYAHTLYELMASMAAQTEYRPTCHGWTATRSRQPPSPPGLGLPPTRRSAPDPHPERSGVWVLISIVPPWRTPAPQGGAGAHPSWLKL